MNGTTGSALIVALPGSSKAVEECCQVLLAGNGLLSHALELLAGGDGRNKHREMQLTGTETDTGKARHYGNDHGHHHHHHHHGHHGHQAPKPRTQPEDTENAYKTHDPTKSVTTRHRSSPYPIISMNDALQLIIQNTHVNDTITLPVTSSLRGHILAQNVEAPRALPPKATTNVDGYALRAEDCPPGSYKVVTKASDFHGRCVFRINTGQSLPEGADAVIMVEDTDLLEQENDEEVSIQVKAQVNVGENVRKAGSDVKKGQLVLQNGVRIGELGGEIGTLAFLGYDSVQVYRKPKVAILSTGNELYDVGESSQSVSKDAWGFRIFDSNRPSLRAALEGAGFEVIDLGITDDDVGKTLEKLNRGLEDADVVLSTGGTSMGESDLLKPLMERSLKDGKIHFGRVAMKPGKVRCFNEQMYARCSLLTTTLRHLVSLRHLRLLVLGTASQGCYLPCPVIQPLRLSASTSL
jgi:gephyrin